MPPDEEKDPGKYQRDHEQVIFEDIEEVLEESPGILVGRLRLELQRIRPRLSEGQYSSRVSGGDIVSLCIEHVNILRSKADILKDDGRIRRDRDG